MIEVPIPAVAIPAISKAWVWERSCVESRIATSKDVVRANL